MEVQNGALEEGGVLSKVVIVFLKTKVALYHNCENALSTLVQRLKLKFYLTYGNSGTKNFIKTFLGSERCGPIHPLITEFA